MLTDAAVAVLREIPTLSSALESELLQVTYEAEADNGKAAEGENLWTSYLLERSDKFLSAIWEGDTEATEWIANADRVLTHRSFAAHASRQLEPYMIISLSPSEHANRFLSRISLAYASNPSATEQWLVKLADYQLTAVEMGFVSVLHSMGCEPERQNYFLVAIELWLDGSGHPKGLLFKPRKGVTSAIDLTAPTLTLWLPFVSPYGPYV